MFQKRANYFLMIGIAIFVSLIVNLAVQAKDCGGNISCDCGDNVTQNRTLTATEPVVVNACAGDGLIMNTAGVVLNLNGHKLRGSGNGVGILISANSVIKIGRASCREIQSRSVEGGV